MSEFLKIFIPISLILGMVGFGLSICALLEIDAFRPLELLFWKIKEVWTRVFAIRIPKPFTRRRR